MGNKKSRELWSRLMGRGPVLEKGDLSEQVTLELKPKGWKGATSDGKSWGKSIPGRGNSECKAAEPGTH